MLKMKRYNYNNKEKDRVEKKKWHIIMECLAMHLPDENTHIAIINQKTFETIAARRHSTYCCLIFSDKYVDSTTT